MAVAADEDVVFPTDGIGGIDFLFAALASADGGCCAGGAKESVSDGCEGC